VAKVAGFDYIEPGHPTNYYGLTGKQQELSAPPAIFSTVTPTGEDENRSNNIALIASAILNLAMTDLPHRFL